MTDTQAKTGTAGGSAEPAEPGAAGDTATDVEAAAERSAVGRATVPSDGGLRTDRSASPEPGTDKIESGVPSAPETAAAARRVEVPTGSATTTKPATRGTAPSTGGRQAPGRGAGSATVDASAAATSSGAARVAEAVRSAKQTVSSAAGRGPRRARLFVKRIDPWSVMKFSFAVSFVLFFVLIVATSVLYLALDSMNVFSDVNKMLASVFTSNNIKITAPAIIGASGAVGLVTVVLFTALSTLGAFIYNVCADLVGGIEVTLSEKE